MVSGGYLLLNAHELLNLAFRKHEAEKVGQVSLEQSMTGSAVVGGV
jgi:hypothetical protein